MSDPIRPRGKGVLLFPTRAKAAPPAPPKRHFHRPGRLGGVGGAPCGPRTPFCMRGGCVRCCYGVLLGPGLAYGLWLVCRVERILACRQTMSSAVEERQTTGRPAAPPLGSGRTFLDRDDRHRHCCEETGRSAGPVLHPEMRFSAFLRFLRQWWPHVCMCGRHSLFVPCTFL